MGELVRLSIAEGVATIVLDNPKANCYSYAVMRELDACILEARMREDVGALLLTGAGDKFFCAGADIGDLSTLTPAQKYAFCLHANETLLRLEQTPKLVVAALNGHTVGGGLEVALACDVRLGWDVPSFKVGLPEVKLGVLPGTGGTQRLTRQLGRARALELMITGETLSMEEATEEGLVQHLLSAETVESFQAQARAYVSQFLPPHAASRAVGHIKRAVAGGADLPLPEGLALERELQQQLFLSQDCREGLAASREKRPPRFSGC